MELRVLRYFLVVAREENITRAAEQLHITQPTLSRQLSQLEEELGVKLFQRAQHGIRLTEDGLLLRRRAQEIIALSEKAQQELSHADEVISGEIAIGSGETKTIQALTRLMAEFRLQYPGVHFDVYTATADDIKERLERGLVDLGLLVEPVDISQYQYLRLPGKERVGVLVRTDSPLAQQDRVFPEDLVGIPLIMVKRPYLMNEMSNWFGEHYDQIEIASTYNLIYNAAIMVQNQVGAAVCIELESQFEDLCFRPLYPMREIGSVLVWKQKGTLPATTRTFLEYVKDALQA